MFGLAAMRAKSKATCTGFLLAFIFGGLASSEEGIECDPPWERVHHACLHFNTTNFRSWAGARKECKSIGAELLVISDDSEFNALQSKTSSSFPIARWWVGLALRAKHMGNPKIFDWTWVDETAYIKGLPRWAPGEPYGTRSTSATEDCVALDYQNNIKDEECIQSLPYICEKRIYNRSPEAKEELPILGLFWPLAVFLLVALCILGALCKKDYATNVTNMQLKILINLTNLYSHRMLRRKVMTTTSFVMMPFPTT